MAGRDDTEGLSSDELLRRAREEIRSGSSLRPPDEGMPPDEHRADADVASEAEPDSANTPETSVATPMRANAAGGDEPTDPERKPSGRGDFWVPLLAAGLVGLLVTVGVALAVRLIGGDDAADEAQRSAAFASGVESGLRQGLEDIGLPAASVECVLDGIEASGAYDRLSELEDAEVVALNTIPADAPLSAYPEQFRPIAEAMATAMSQCVDPSQTGGLALPTGLPDALGDDPDLDRLWNRCEETGAEACDLLYLVSPVGSAYEGFGKSCGDRSPTVDDACLFVFGGGPRLSEWRSECASGDAGACDLLYQFSPIDSDDERFGITCGGRDEASPINCWNRFGARLG